MEEEVSKFQNYLNDFIMLIKGKIIIIIIRRRTRRRMIIIIITVIMINIMIMIVILIITVTSGWTAQLAIQISIFVLCMFVCFVLFCFLLLYKTFVDISTPISS